MTGEPLESPDPKAMLCEAMSHLEVVVRYGLDAMKDRMDAEHIVAAHTLIVALWGAQK